MDDMQFAKYSYDTREILQKVDKEGLENLVRNAVAYVQSNNRSKANWLASELFVDVIPDAKESNMKVVKMDDDLIKTARDIGICLGDQQKQDKIIKIFKKLLQVLLQLNYKPYIYLKTVIWYTLLYNKIMGEL